MSICRSVGPLQGPEGPLGSAARASGFTQTPRRSRPPSTLPSVGAIVEPRKPATGPISPELVLVDPDLAAGARAALPDHPWPAPVRIEPATPTRHRRIPVAAIFSFLSFAALVGILGVSLLPTRDQPTFAAEGQRIQPAAPSRTAGVSRPAAPQERARQANGGGPRSPCKPYRGKPVPRFRPTRTFAWVSQPRAVYYQVTFFRNGRRVYQRRTRSPRVTLPTPRSVHARRLPLDRPACDPSPERHAPRRSSRRLHVQNWPQISSS